MSTDRPPNDPRRRAADAARARLRPGGKEPGSPVAPAGREEGGGGSSAEAEQVTVATGPEVARPETEPGSAEPAPLSTVAATAATEPEVVRTPPLATGGRSRLTAALGAACVLLAAGLVVALVALHSEDQKAANASAVARARATALAAAKSYAVDLSSYNYNDLQASADRVLAHSTSSFRKSYSGSSSALNTVLEHYKASAVGKVLAAGIESATPNQVVVLLFLDQTATNTQHKGPTTDESRLEMTLVHQHDQWLIDRVLVV